MKRSALMIAKMFLIGLAAVVVPASMAFGAEDTPKTKPAGEPSKLVTGGKLGHPQVELVIGRDGKAWGSIILELDEKRAPITVKNFLCYVDEGYYDGTIFHRVIPTFMVQGGGFTSPRDRKTEGAHAPIQNESKGGLPNARGTVAMARIGRQHHSATSQFFINVVDNPKLNHPSYDGAGYAVFGKVIKGDDIVEKIRTTPTGPHPLDSRVRTMPTQPPVLMKAQRTGPRRRVLVVCPGGSSRAQMVEGFWRAIDGVLTEVHSAGVKAKEKFNPLAVKVMAEEKIDISGQKPRKPDPFVDQPWDLVITVGDKAKESCPTFPKARRTVHIPIGSLSAVEGSEDEKLEAFRKARDQIKAVVTREVEKLAAETK